MFIRRFAINNFKIHRDTSLDLFPITVFVGPNSGGKSAIFDALINFSMVSRGNLSEAFNQYPFSFGRIRVWSGYTSDTTLVDIGSGGSRSSRLASGGLLQLGHPEPVELREWSSILINKSVDSTSEGPLGRELAIQSWTRRLSSLSPVVQAMAPVFTHGIP